MMPTTGENGTALDPSGSRIFSPNYYRPLVVLVVWYLFLACMADTARNYHFGETPPLWDNLGYQIKGVTIARAILENQWNVILDYWGKNQPVGFTGSLALVNLIFGLKTSTPYLLSIVFGLGCLLACFQLAVHLGASPRVTFWATANIAVLPSFLYQTVFQTRNDYPLAFFLTVSWLYFLKALQTGCLRFSLFSGILIGIGTLFKLSAPGYVIFWILTSFLPFSALNRLEWKNRWKHISYWTVGAVLICGWFYLPSLSRILDYYRGWSQMSQWQMSQYGIYTFASRMFFYFTNFFRSHLTTPYSLLFLGWFAGFLIYRLLGHQRKAWRREMMAWMKSTPIQATVLVTLLPVGFLTWRGSFSSLGDVPILLLLYALGITVLSITIKDLGQTHGFTVLASILLLGSCGYSFSHLPMEKQTTGKEFVHFCEELQRFRNDFGLESTPLLNSYSHPVYNTSAVLWRWHMTREGTLAQLVSSDVEDRYRLIQPEDPEIIARKLAALPILIQSEQDPLQFGGESFHTFNRLYTPIRQELDKQNQFISVREIRLKEEHCIFQILVNKTLSYIHPIHITADDWLEWGQSIELHAFSNFQIQWLAIPIRHIEDFTLVSRNREKDIRLVLKKIHPNGIYEFISDSVVAGGKKEMYTLTGNPALMIAASTQDSRKLSFRNSKISLLYQDGNEWSAGSR